MDVRQFISDRLLQDTKRDADSLQILSTSSHVDINGFQSSIVNDGILALQGFYLNERDSQMIALMEYILFESCKIIHDQCLLSWVHQIDAISSCEQSHACKGKELTELVRHHKQILQFNSDFKQYKIGALIKVYIGQVQGNFQAIWIQIIIFLKIQLTMAEDQVKKKKGPPFQTLPNKQIMPLQGLGTYRIKEQKVLTDLLRKGLQVGGCKHIDTARLYNNQIPLGNAIKTVISEGRVKRQELFIATKIFNFKGQSVQKQLKESLQLMQLKYFDLLYLHWPYTDLNQQGQFNHKPLEQIWPEMEQCITKGYVKHLGISNFNGQLIMELLTICKIKPVALQIQVHPYLPNTALVELAQKNGIAVIAYTPLVRGQKLNRGDEINILKDEVILDLSSKHGRTPAQIVLKSTLQRGIGVIPRTTNPNRLQQNFESWNFELSEDDIKKIKALSRGYRVCDAFTNLPVFD